MREKEETIGSNYRYADKLTHSLFESNDVQLTGSTKRGTLVTESAMALNLWMYIAHELYDALDDCSLAMNMNKEEALSRNSGSTRALDEAIAYWIGTDQDGGTNRGHSLYSLTQRAGEMFGTLLFDAEARANSDIRTLYHYGRSLLAFPSACTGDDTDLAMRGLHNLTNKMLAKMMIPLIQMLLYSIYEQDNTRIKIYATAVVPQISACSDPDYTYLKRILIDTVYERSEFHSVLYALQRSYSCLGVTCEEIGAYSINKIPICAETPTDHPLAGYVPKTDIRNQAKIDLDIKQIQILSLYPASFSAIRNIYYFGKNSPDGESFRTLHEFATSSLRSGIPWFQRFHDYFGTDNFADENIQNAIDKSKNWIDSSDVQRGEAIVQNIKLSVMIIFAMRKFYDALFDCKISPEDDRSIGLQSWDEGVAYFSGSLEGGRDNDASNGVLLMKTASEMCLHFEICVEGETAPIVAELISLFNKGIKFVIEGKCDDIESTIGNIEFVMLVPLVQGIIHYALINEKLDRGSFDGSLAIGDAFARALVPHISAFDSNSASSVDNNMSFTTTRKPVQDGSMEVANALDTAIDKGLKVECQFIGSEDNIELECEDSEDGAFAKYSVSTIILSVFAVIFGLVSLLIFVLKNTNKINRCKEKLHDP